MDSLQQLIGKNLFDIRKKRGLSLDKAAELTGVSKGMLAQIEKGKTNPTVTTLWKIANGLNVSFSAFMKEEETQITQVKKEQLQALVDDQGNYLVYPLFPYHPQKKFEIYSVDIQPGGSHFSDVHTKNSEEFVLVSDGELTIEIQHQEFTLKKGEALSFQAHQTHIYKNASTQKTSFFVIIYYQE
ncbi:helix-turn-helix domain-containing protein [Pseudobacillus badius]|uniref:helix-turn-helix domain-containing protein n=1 Tax=Bacillus badius TaxID=1455 RepID=UPI0007B081E5|nr:XRE family transcriptional regulator [Bacillus badius]KZN99627.1 DNA-binding protein [Bacillus badius]KZR57833.1 DNA-binding protein [Bacillus badius]MED0665848.1 XRE family transcriptional regulator [Bacillus badius]OCS85731.1 DNA-binding protein [Bacillus badius]OVE51913.1 DNA-binding protein [Bacillus badius]